MLANKILTKKHICKIKNYLKMHEQELAYDIKNYFPQTVSGDLHWQL